MSDPRRPGTWRQRIAAWLTGPRAPQPAGRRMYAAARPGRTANGFGASGNSSADAELSSSLPRLRAASRQMVRDSAYAKRAQQVVVNNVIGSGIGIEAQIRSTRDELRESLNTAIEEAWAEWTQADACHTGGALAFGDLERALAAQVFEAGEVFVRAHYTREGASRVPLALELVEAERVPDSFVQPGEGAAGGETRMGIECNEQGRALFYWIRTRHPGDIRARAGTAERYERVPAADVFHLRIVERWPQTRGVPWMHAVLRKFDDLNELTGAELAAVRASSYYFGTITTPEADTKADGQDETGKQVYDIEPLMIQQLAAGEKLDFHMPNRPNANLDAFLRHMVREMAAGTLNSYESLSRDYSQSNYSSSRLALMEDRDNWKALQQWWIRSLRMPLHRMWLRQAALARAIEGLAPQEYAINPAKFEAVRFKPRGWSWIDPTKEVAAYKEAIKAGLTTATDVIAATADGRSIEDVIATLKRERQLFEEAGIHVDTEVPDPDDVAPPAPAPAPAAPPQDDGEDDDAPQPAGRAPRRVVSLATR